MSSKPSYELIDHTADFGMKVCGSSVKDLFHNAALALMDQLVEESKPRDYQTRHITVAGDDWPDLMVNWLREILYLWAGEEMLVRSVQIKALSASKLSALVDAEGFHRSITS